MTRYAGAGYPAPCPRGSLVIVTPAASRLPQLRVVRPWRQPGRPWVTLVPGLLVASAGVIGALGAHQLVGQIGVLTWSVLLGVVATNLRMIPERGRPGLRLATRKALRTGIVLLGFSLPLAEIAALGVPTIALVVVTLVTTLLLTIWFGLRLGIGRPRSVLIATGFAVCGASAVAAVQENADADDEDVAAAIAMVTVCGTLAMVVLPLLQDPLGLGDTEFGVWAGASVHEVGQVVAAASPAGAAALAVAVVVKLTRVMLLAPVVAGVGMARRRREPGPAGGEAGPAGARPPIVPLFVVGFLICVLIRSSGVVPEGLLQVIETIQIATLSAALFGMGTGVVLRSLVRGSGTALLLSAASTVVVACVSLAGVALVV